MNYFELHIGDYAEATAHLTFVEDAAYIRMLRKYYSTEKPLPAEKKSVQRLVGARTKEEREAVETVLEEFFTLQEDGWHNARCDEELARYQAGEPEREVKKANEENRLKRHREERARLFKRLTDNGLHAPWNISMGELRELVKGLPDTQPDTAADTPAPPLPATAPATPATATQTPVTNHQSKQPGVSGGSTDSGSGGDMPPPPEMFDDDDRFPPRPQLATVTPDMRAVAIATLLTGAGVKKVTAFHPDIAVTWAQDERVTDVLLLDAVKRAKESLGDEPFHTAYLRPIVVELLNPPPPKPAKPKSDDWAWKRSNPGIEAKGRELSMFARGGESYADFAARIEAELERRKGRAA